MKIRAYAKLNLGLRVKEKRPDGYHDIESIFQKIDFFDEIEIEPLIEGRNPLPQIEFKTNVPPYGKDNICYKAAEIFFKETGIKKEISIKLKKNIWMGAGLGGGSSCGASTLKGLNEVFGEPLSSLHKLALKLGSDVPFFLGGSCEIVSGRGEVIEEIPSLPNLPDGSQVRFVLVYPKFAISTGWAYLAYRQTGKNLKKRLTGSSVSIKKLLSFWGKGDIKGIGENLFNDFEPLVMKEYPVLKKIKERLFSLNLLGVSLTGSGSCIYGIIDREYDFKKLFQDMDVEMRIARSI